MRQRAAAMGLARRAIASVITGLALLAVPAMAGDRALIEVIGYSEDGRYFAFEEFGVSDGAGFAYSNIYVVDLQNDSWIGAPVRIQGDSEEAPIAAIRDEAREDAKKQLDALHIATPAQTLALLGDGVPNADGQTLRFGMPSYGVGTVEGDYRLALTTYPVTSASPCQEWFSYDPLGFALTVAEAGETADLHRDKSLPESRGCPQTYRLFSVVVPFEAQDLTSGVAIISVYPGGFEGPDRRFIAVPLGQ